MLSKMRIASFTHWLQGPAASQYLADMGADVIKIEQPGGSYERGWAPANKFVGGHGTLYLAANRNARNLVINLKDPKGIHVARKLIETCDVVIENYRPGVMDRLGLGYEAIKEIKPDIIYASATGYGPDGPLSKGPGQDLLVQARAGVVALTGAQPTPIGMSGIDQHGASLLALGILGAYVKKLTTGEGTKVEGSLYNSCVDFMQEGLVHYFSGGHTRDVLARDPHLSCWYLGAPYGTYPLKDAAVVVSINAYEKLAAALQDDRIAALVGLDQWDHKDECARVLGEVLAELSFAEVKERFDSHGVWYERVQDLDDMRDDPQAAYAEIFKKIDVNGETATLINHPIRYDGAPPPFKRMPLEPGEHTHDIMAEIGFSDTETREFLDSGAVEGQE